MTLAQINILLSILVIFGQIFIVCMSVYLLFFRRKISKMTVFVHGSAIWLAFLVALTATLGSLYYSEIAKFAPCDLCWFQRIFMYPQVAILGLAILKKEKSILDYSLLLSCLGTILSLYHNYIYYAARATSFCSVTSCTQRYVTGFDYITIPLMALTGFVLIDLLLLNRKLRQ